MFIKRKYIDEHGDAITLIEEFKSIEIKLKYDTDEDSEEDKLIAINVKINDKQFYFVELECDDIFEYEIAKRFRDEIKRNIVDDTRLLDLNDLLNYCVSMNIEEGGYNG